MKTKKNKVINNHVNIYSITTLIILIIYVIGLIHFLTQTHNEIKKIYTDIWNKQTENNYLRAEILRLKIEKMNFIFNLDHETDNSIYKFVTSTKSFNDKQYTPNDLEKIESKFIFDTKWWNQILRKEANKALQKLGWAFYRKFNKKLSVISAYRSYNYQKGIKNWWCPDNFCAKAWFSEHQSWLAVDLLEVSTVDSWTNNLDLTWYFNWLNQNANIYGFHNTYQKWLKVDWYEIEPWHWRYLWEEFATYLKGNKLTIAEFYKQQ